MKNWHNLININRKGFALMHQLEPRLFWTNVIQGIFEAVYPFIPFFFTSRILSLLLSGTFNEQLRNLVIGALVSSFVSTLIANGLSHIRTPLFYRAMDEKEMLLNKKIIEMDYEFVENTTVHEQLNSIRMNEMTGGRGMHRLFDSSKHLVKHFTSILVALVFLWSLVTSESTRQTVPVDVDSGWIILGFAGALIMYLAVILFLNQKVSKIEAKFMKNGVALNNAGGYLFSFLNNYNAGKEIRLYNQYPYMHQLLNRFGDFTKETLMGIFKATSRTTVLSNAVSYTILTMGYLWILGKAFNGAIPAGAVIQYGGAMSLFIMEFPELLEQVTDFINNSEALQHFFGFLEMKGNRHEGTLPVEKRLDQEYTLEARNVSFAYPGSDELVLENVNLKLGVGEKLAIVGMNGSGKTTFIKLLCRLYDPTEGEILLNGIDIRKYDYQEYLRLLSVVFQDFQLYSFQLGENVAASKSIDETEAADALKKAGFAERYRQLTDGLDTYLYKNYDETGIEISGGEAQKIAMARAIYKKAPIVILDEPTAALDPLSEYDMYTSFSEVVGNRTAIYISHRLSSCRFCDTIAVFDNGKIIQKGSHNELVQDKEGKYYELWHAQAQYYKKNEDGEVKEVALA